MASCGTTTATSSPPATSVPTIPKPSETTSGFATVSNGSPAPACSGPLTPTFGGLRAVIKSSTPPMDDDAPHVIVKARAGTGKTTTIVEGIKDMKGLPVGITPSEQQRAVWDQLRLSKDARTVCIVAFNKSIAAELQRRVPPGVDAGTQHSLGFRACQKALGRLEPNEWVTKDMVAELLGRDLRELLKDAAMNTLVKAVVELVDLVKMNLVDPTEENLQQLADHHGVEMNGQRAKAFELVPQIIERSKTPQGKITFADMIWLPVVLDLPVFQYDLLLIDESQDLNRCQQALAKKAGRRLVFVGDPKQSIYGFCGADVKSMTRLEEELAMTERGVVVLPLTVTRRCGKAIVREANRWVPEFEAHESNGDGAISAAAYPGKTEGGKDVPWERSYGPLTKEGDMVLCRCNAPLVSQVFQFIRRGRKANIQGRDIGKGLQDAVKKMKAADAFDLIAKIDDWKAAETRKENSKRNPSEHRITAIADRAECLTVFAEGAQTVAEVLAKIDGIFTDDQHSPGVRLSSIHKAKGLEADRVFILQPERCGPNPAKLKDWELEQEDNLRYVSVTRAIKELTYVSPHAPLGESVDDKVDVKPTAEAVAKAEKARVAPTTFSWAKGKGDEWLIRGPKGASGVVEVESRNGHKAKKRLGKVVREFEEAALYAVS